MHRYQLQAAEWVSELHACAGASCRLRRVLMSGMRAQVRPLLEAMGRGVVELGDDPATAAAAKLVGNFMIISQASLFAGFKFAPTRWLCRHGCH